MERLARIRPVPIRFAPVQRAPTRLALIVAALLALPVATTFAAAAGPPQPQEPLPAHGADQASGEAAVPAFEQLDGDADRTLTLEEVPEHTRLFRDFARWDANKDGVLNVPEFNRYVEQLAQL